MQLALFIAAILTICCIAELPASRADPVPLPPLPYAYDALEPVFSSVALETHYAKHHKTYCDKMNAAFDEARSTSPALAQIVDKGVDYVLQHLAEFPPALGTKIRNMAGGFGTRAARVCIPYPPTQRVTHISISHGYSSYLALPPAHPLLPHPANHNFFWQVMRPPRPNNAPNATSALGVAITKQFGSFDTFKAQFSTEGNGVFGSGWSWLYVIPGDTRTAAGLLPLYIKSTPNQDTPFSDGDGLVLTIDVWEHSCTSPSPITSRVIPLHCPLCVTPSRLFTFPTSPIFAHPFRLPQLQEPARELRH